MKKSTAKRANKTTRSTRARSRRSASRGSLPMVKLPADSHKWNKEHLQGLFDILCHMRDAGMVPFNGKRNDTRARNYLNKVGLLIDEYSGRVEHEVPSYMQKQISRYDWLKGEVKLAD